MVNRLITWLKSASPLRVLPLFLAIPVLVLALKRAGIAPSLDVNLMIANMLLCCCYLLFRVGTILRRFDNAAQQLPARHLCTGVSQPVPVVGKLLQQAGYRLNRHGDYGERGWRGLASMIALLSLALLLLLGSYDNLYQFGGVVLVGTGDPSLLYDPAAYTMYSHGPLAKFPDLDFKLKGVDRFMPSSTYPYGAAELRLTTRDDRLLWQGTLAALGAPRVQNGFIFAMNSLEYNIGLIMLVNENHLLYTDWLHLVPMVTPVPGFTHEGTLNKDKLNDVDGTALYNEATERLTLHIRYKKEYIDVELGEAPNHEKQVGRYKFINQGTARQSQVRVSRVRHKAGMLGLLASTLLAILAALCSPRRRVWLRPGEHASCEVITETARNSDEMRAMIGKMGADCDKG